MTSDIGARRPLPASGADRHRTRIGLRARLSMAFVFVVLIPVLVGCLLVAVIVPDVLRGQVSGRLRADRTDVSDLLAAQCGHAMLDARALGLRLVGTTPQQAVRASLAESRADYAAVVDASGAAVAEAGRRPAGVTDLSVLDGCGSGRGAEVAIAGRVELAVGNHPDWRYAVVAWLISPQTAADLQAHLADQPAVTLAVGSEIVSSTLPLPVARAQLAAIRPGADVTQVGSRIVAVHDAAAGEPYRILVSRPVPELGGLPWIFLGIIGFATAGAIAIGRFLARLISQPVAELSEAASRVAGGDLDITLPVRSRDEVGRLAAAFNHMTAELRRYIGQLERSHAELRENLERLGAALAQTHNLPGILAVIVDTAMASVRASAGLVALFESDGVLHVKVSRGLPELAPDAVVPLGAGIIGRVAERGTPVHGVVGDGPGLRPIPEEPRRRTVLAVPLRQAGRISGVLAVYDQEETGDGGAAFTENDVRTLGTFAGQASVAIENVLLHQEAERLSLTDALTGLWNYRYLTMTLGHEIERATRFRRPLALLMIDLDRFKDINDRHGHQAGDAVLVELARRLHTTVREVDTVARYGGEEFVVILPETDADGAAHTAERLRQAVRGTPFHVEQMDIPVTASIGIAVFPRHGSSAAILLRAADEALYVAKHSGRDAWRFARAGGETPAGSAAPRIVVVPEAGEPASVPEAGEPGQPEAPA